MTNTDDTAAAAPSAGKDQRIPLSAATEEQLRHFATVIMGLDVHHFAKAPGIIAKLQEAGITSLPADTTAAASAPPSARRSGEAFNTRINPKTNKPETKIMIHTDPRPGGQEPVKVGVNGVWMLIPRGEAVWVPDEYVHVLQNAKEVAFDEYTKGDGGLQGKREVLSYPFQYA